MLLPPSPMIKELTEQQFRELDLEARRALLARAHRKDRTRRAWVAARAQVAAAIDLTLRRAARRDGRSRAASTCPSADCPLAASHPPMSPPT